MRHWRSAGLLLGLTDVGNTCGDPAALELDGDGERTFRLREAGDAWVVERITAAGVSVLYRGVSLPKAGIAETALPTGKR